MKHFKIAVVALLMPFVIASCASEADPNPGEWTVVGQRSFSDGIAVGISLYVSNGIPYVAYSDYAASARKTTVMKFNGSTWEPVGPKRFSNVANSHSLVVYNGTPYLAFCEDSGASVYKATVVRFNGRTWEPVGTQYISGQASLTRLAIEKGTLYVAFSDDKGGMKATVMKY